MTTDWSRERKHFAARRLERAWRRFLRWAWRDRHDEEAIYEWPPERQELEDAQEHCREVFEGSPWISPYDLDRAGA